MERLNLQSYIEGLRRGEKEAFEYIFREFYPLLNHICTSYLGDYNVSEEIVHDCFLKLWDIRHTLTHHFNIRNYLYTVAKNRCLNQLRNQKILLKHHQQISYMEAQFNYEALEKLGNYQHFEELMSKLDEAIEKLPNDIAETFRLSRYEELSYKEIAQRQGISVKTVEARISKALKILRHDLKDYLPLFYLFSKIFS